MACKFEYANVTWMELEDLRSNEDWDRWASEQRWDYLAPVQEMRYRCAEDILYFGNGWVSVPYRKSDHPNMFEKPNWSLFLS